MKTIESLMIIGIMVLIVGFFIHVLLTEHKRRRTIRVAKISQNKQTFYTNDLSHPLAMNAEIIRMTKKEYESIPATLEAFNYGRSNN